MGDETKDTGVKSLWQKMGAVMAGLDYMRNDGTIRFGGTNYTFLSAEKTVSEIGTVMKKEGLLFFILKTHFEEAPGPEYARLINTYRIVDIDSGNFQDIQIAGEGQDRGDKRVSKANTNALKYALWQTFMVPRGDDPDHTSSDELNQPRPAPRITPSKPAQPTPENTDAAKMKNELQTISDMFATPEEKKDIDEVLQKNIPAILQGKYKFYHQKYFSKSTEEKQKSEQQELGVNTEDPNAEPTLRKMWYSDTNFLDPKTTREEMVRVVKEIVDPNDVTGAVASAFMINKQKSWKTESDILSLTKGELKDLAKRIWDKKDEKKQ